MARNEYLTSDTCSKYVTELEQNDIVTSDTFFEGARMVESRRFEKRDVIVTWKNGQESRFPYHVCVMTQTLEDLLVSGVRAI